MNNAIAMIAVQGKPAPTLQGRIKLKTKYLPYNLI
jgi:hypothetical protein